MKNKITSATENIKYGKMVQPDWWFDGQGWGGQTCEKSLNVEEEADWGRSEGKVFEDERLSA